jgi:hypothetical protein
LVAAPAVDRQGQGAADANIVERLFLVVRRDRAADVPIPLLDDDLVAKRADQLVARRGRHAAELDRSAVAADRIDAGRLLVGVDRDEAVEIGQALLIIVRVAHPGDGLTGLVMGEFEGAGAEDVLLVPVRVLVEDGFLVDPVERVGDRRQKRGGGKFEPEYDGCGIGRLDLVDHQKIGDAGAEDALRREDDRAEGRGHVIGGQHRPVVKLHPLPDLEGVGLAVVGRLRHRDAEVADKIGCRCGIVRVDPHQEAVERRAGVHGGEGALAVRVEARRRVGRDHVGQRAAALWRLLGHRGRCEGQPGDQRGDGTPKHHSHASLPLSGLLALLCYLSSQIVARSWLT